MTTKIRKQIYLESEQDNLIKELASQHKISEAEVIRQAINQQISLIKTHCNQDLTAWEQELSFIKQRINPTITQIPRNWTREDLYER
jgi:hypothetical protein